MAISKIAGQMLYDNLLRDGANLAISDTAIDVPVVFFDITNERVGINTVTPGCDLDVTGNICASDISATANITSNQLTVGNLTMSGSTLTSTLTNGNILLDATGTGIVQIEGVLGVSIPVGDTGDRPNPAIAGTLRFNTDTSLVEIYTGTEWKNAGSIPTVITNQTIEGNGGDAVFTLDQEATATGILVTINGVNQTPGVDYDVTGNQITFTTVPIVTDTIQVRFISQITTVSALTNVYGNTSVATTSAGNIDFEINSTVVAQVTNTNILDISAAHSLQLPTYTVSQANGLTNVASGQMIYVSDGASGTPCLAVYSGGAWKQVAIGSNITT